MGNIDMPNYRYPVPRRFKNPALKSIAYTDPKYIKVEVERKPMGFYIEVNNPKNKTQQILDLYGGIICINAPEWEDITSDEAIICRSLIFFKL